MFKYFDLFALFLNNHTHPLLSRIDLDNIKEVSISITQIYCHEHSLLQVKASYKLYISLEKEGSFLLHIISWKSILSKVLRPEVWFLW